MPMIVQNVHQSASHLGWRLQDPRVVAVRKEKPPPTEATIHPSGDANGEPLHGARKGRPCPCLYQEMQMVRLDREVNEPHAQPFFRCPKGCEDQRGQRSLSKIGHATPELQGDVNRMPRFHLWPPHVPHTRLRAMRLPTSTRTPTAATAHWKLELNGCALCHPHTTYSSNNHADSN